MTYKIEYILLFLIVITNFTCSTEEKLLYKGQGLVGAYYGNPDLTNVKEAEILSDLDRNWDEKTGHGSAWSGHWEGMLTAAADGMVKILLRTNKEAVLKIGLDLNLSIDGSGGEKSVSMRMKEGESYPLDLIFMHKGGNSYFQVLWQWGGSRAEPIPEEYLYHTAQQARKWNWIPEPDPEDIATVKMRDPSAENIIVYYQKGRFCGWPANNGIWRWGNEILVGFTLGYYLENERHHSIDEDKPKLSVLARSLDGGGSWQLEDPENFVGDPGDIQEISEKINFLDPGFALRINNDQFFYSYDRGHTWQGNFKFPDFNGLELTSRTDYQVINGDACLVFLSAKEEKVQARLQDRAFAARTIDGGKTFQFLSWMTDDLTVRSVMPATVSVADNHLISALRRRYDRTSNEKPKLPENWIDVYQSTDNGNSWQFLSKVANTDMGKHNGNPPSLIRLQDGRLCLTYAYRARPYSIRAKLSDDMGKTWRDIIEIRNSIREFDCGYTRSVQRPDGKIVTIYYLSTVANYEQHIAATIWDPDNLQYMNK